MVFCSKRSTSCRKMMRCAVQIIHCRLFTQPITTPISAYPPHVLYDFRRYRIFIVSKEFLLVWSTGRLSSKLCGSTADIRCCFSASVASAQDRAWRRPGITRLYSHQHRAICSVLANRDVIVATPTASGKSMIYNLPVLNDLLADDPGHSLYIFPLKALARDQQNVLESLFHQLPAAIQANLLLSLHFLTVTPAATLGEKSAIDRREYC